MPFLSLLEKDSTATVEPPLGREITAQLIRVAADHCDQVGGCHGPDHSLRVQRTALYMGGQLAARLDVLSAAALLHDIGRREETASQGAVCHAAKGAEMARDILTGFAFTAPMINQVAHCIATHRYRDNNRPQSLEAEILFDADKLDSVGAIGIGRAFLFAGQVGAKLHNANSDIRNTESYSVEDTAYREFRVKLCKVKDRMLTPVGRRLAAERHAFMETFFERLEREIG